MLTTKIKRSLLNNADHWQQFSDFDFEPFEVEFVSTPEFPRKFEIIHESTKYQVRTVELVKHEKYRTELFISGVGIASSLVSQFCSSASEAEKLHYRFCDAYIDSRGDCND